MGRIRLAVTAALLVGEDINLVGVLPDQVDVLECSALAVCISVMLPSTPDRDVGMDVQSARPCSTRKRECP